MAAKAIMIQGTMSNAGKSVLTAGLCRIFRQDGYSVAPFKSQNMALNSFVTREGLEMGRAQVMQAEAAGVEPSVRMNPILLKPSSDMGSQVIVNGEVLGDMRASDYFRHKKELVPQILASYRSLAEEHDVIVLEGAGSPAEINLKADDIVNMGMARMARAPVLLAGDIDRGGVFASLYGTVALLEAGERAMVKGTVINKFRGDAALLRPGLTMLEELTQIPVVGVVPWLELDLDDEDSLSERLTGKHGSGPLLDRSGHEAFAKVTVVKLPRISNFTDFNSLERLPGIALSYVSRPEGLTGSDLIIIPGTKNTMGDLLWMRQNGLEAAVKKLSCEIPVFGICGGYQMLGASIADPDGVEEGGYMRGMELLPIDTVLKDSKTRLQTSGEIAHVDGVLSRLSGCHFLGYEIHMGKSAYSTASDEQGACDDRKNELNNVISDGGNVYG
ncbi:MAG: cobyric acid synthase, partial [Clostridiales bacterium]|nr:cobyric acid synthase [Clostridiales bacterium]